MPATLSISTDLIVDSIVKYYEGSTEITTAQLREWANVHSYTYSTIRNRLVKDGYQTGRGKFNLKKAQQVAQLEETYSAPAVTGGGGTCTPPEPALHALAPTGAAGTRLRGAGPELCLHPAVLASCMVTPC